MSARQREYERASNDVRSAELALATAESNLIKARRAKNEAWREYHAEVSQRFDPSDHSKGA